MKPIKKEKEKLRNYKNNIYLVNLAYGFSKSRVINAFIKQIISYLLWVFYSAYFVRFVLDVIKNEYPLPMIFLSVGAVGTVSLALQIYIYYCDHILFPKENVKIYQGIYEKIYKKAINVEVACYENPDFYNKFTRALDGAGDNICQGIDNISQITGGIICAIVAFWTMLQIDKFTIIFLIAPLIGNFVIAPRLNKIGYRRYKDSVPYNRVLDYTNRVMYLKDYAKELRLSNIHNVLFANYNNAAKSKSSLWEKYFKGSFVLGMLQYIFSYMVIFEGILIYGTYNALIRKSIYFEEMAVLTSVMVTASWVLVGVIRAVYKVIENGLLLLNLKEFLEYEEKIPEDYDGIDPGNKVTSIEFRNVSFSYDGKKTVLDNISFKIEENMKVALAGHNGAGKTTIIKLLLRFYDPTEGQILVNGTDIRKYNLQKYRKLFTCAFQDYKIMPGTVRYNVLMGREGNDETVICALKEAEVYDKVNRLKYDIDTVLTKEFDEEGEMLSGGEYQKIIVARAFANKEASVAIFDEPSSALDPISESNLFDRILYLTKDRIGIFISHRLSCVKDADKVLMFENGKLVEYGTHSQLMANGGPYSVMYNTQEKNYYAIDDLDTEAV